MPYSSLVLYLSYLKNAAPQFMRATSDGRTGQQTLMTTIQPGEQTVILEGNLGVVSSTININRIRLEDGKCPHTRLIDDPGNIINYEQTSFIANIVYIYILLGFPPFGPPRHFSTHVLTSLSENVLK